MCVASGVLLSVLCVISNVQTLRQLRGSVSHRASRLSGKRGYSGGLAPAKRENGLLRLCVLHYRARSCTRRVALEGASRNDATRTPDRRARSPLPRAVRLFCTFDLFLCCCLIVSLSPLCQTVGRVERLALTLDWRRRRRVAVAVVVASRTSNSGSTWVPSSRAFESRKRWR
jgi:hypothetical protein